MLEKCGSFFQRPKNRGRRQLGCQLRLNSHPRFVITARHMDREASTSFSHLEAPKMVDTRKQSAPDEGIEPRRGISPRNVHAFPTNALILPFHCNAVSSVLR